MRAHESCRKNFIHVLTLPPHTSHRMQPLDLTFQKQHIITENVNPSWSIIQAPKLQATMYSLYTKAFNITTGTNKAMKDRKSAGICLMDQDKFKHRFESFGDTFALVLLFNK